jgi:hypothetical protein
MPKTEPDSNELTIGNIKFKTSGNIVFEDHQNNPFFLAESNLIDKMDNFLQKGIQMMLKKPQD